MTKEDRDIQRKFKVLRHAEKIGMWPRPAVTSAWADQASIAGRQLTSKVVKPGWSTPSPFRKTLPTRPPPEIVDKVLYLRSNYHLGSIGIVWYLARYHGITISDAGVTHPAPQWR